MSTSRNALRNREACVLSSGMPNMLGYCDATPACRAARSASTPARSGGSPGTPISRWRNSTPVSRSIMRAMSPDWRIVACAMSAMSIRSSAECRQDLSNGIFMALPVFGPLRSRHGTPRGSFRRPVRPCGRRWRGCLPPASRRRSRAAARRLPAARHVGRAGRHGGFGDGIRVEGHDVRELFQFAPQGLAVRIVRDVDQRCGVGDHPSVVGQPRQVAQRLHRLHRDDEVGRAARDEVRNGWPKCRCAGSTARRRRAGSCRGPRPA